MPNSWLYDDLTALELFELAAEHPQVAELMQEWLLAEDDRDRAALFVELIEAAEELIVEIELDF